MAHVWLVAIRRLEYKAPSNQNLRYLYLPSLDLVQRELVVFWLISPRALYYTTRGLWVLEALDTTKQQQKQIYRLHNVCEAIEL